MMRKNEGFTLVELIVTILVSTLVAGAAATAILLGLRINRQSTQVQTQQNTTRILLSILEDMASEGNIGKVENNFGSWKICGEMPDADTDGPLLMSYENGAIQSASGETLMDGIFASEASYDDAYNLLSIQIETETGIFSSTIHCKMGNVTETGNAATTEQLKNEAATDLAGMEETKEARMQLLNLLSDQRESGGWVTPKNPTDPMYFSKWYITTKEDESSWGKNGWDQDTPWCACFVSWGLSRISETHLTYPVGRTVTKDEVTTAYWYANVDEFMAYFQELTPPEGGGILYWNDVYLNESAPLPNPGDVIFFDRQVYDGELNPDHMGVVFHVDKKIESDPSDDVIFTIEGNSMGRVAIRQYSASNKTIVGYGVLPWIPVTTTE